MKRFTKLALLAGLAMGAANLGAPSQAQADVHIGLGFFGPPAPVYYAPPPVYYAPPVYCAYSAYHYHYAPPVYHHRHHHHYGPRCW